MKRPTNNTHLPEKISTEILARLPLRSISSFKSVCKTWKSTTESIFFRRLFVSLHKNSSSSWSLIRGSYRCEDYIGLYGCQTWDLPKSPASYITVLPDLRTGNFVCYFSSNGLVLMEGIDYGCYVGNPVLQQWVKIPSCPYKSHRFGFVTRVDEDGVVLSFKVLRLKDDILRDMCIYFSETGIWTYKRLHIPSCAVYSCHMSFNGLHYFLSGAWVNSDAEKVIAHDFYSKSDQFRAIQLPDHYGEKYKRTLTTS
ncbi:unnamed protein product [Arabis nemorensis]|uniref:F-box domain-containing protein n=1 Tax=Arabis nemorensis TaxID=586526 RepID=A0A565CFB7_9BRAS|nr:unnamed protein product [Arabis nemorensis]